MHKLQSSKAHILSQCFKSWGYFLSNGIDMPARSHLGRSLWIDTLVENLSEHKRIRLKTSESDWGGDWTGSAVTMPVPQSPSSHTWHHVCVYSREIHKPVIRSTDLLSCILCIHMHTPLSWAMILVLHPVLTSSGHSHWSCTTCLLGNHIIYFVQGEMGTGESQTHPPSSHSLQSSVVWRVESLRGRVYFKAS